VPEDPFNDRVLITAMSSYYSVHSRYAGRERLRTDRVGFTTWRVGRRDLSFCSREMRPKPSGDLLSAIRPLKSFFLRFASRRPEVKRPWQASCNSVVGADYGTSLRHCTLQAQQDAAVWAVSSHRGCECMRANYCILTFDSAHNWRTKFVSPGFRV
jgi:hypothetical protein